MARWHSANVLQTTPGGRQLWRFNANGTGFIFSEEQKLAINEQIPSDLVAKDWRTLVRSKLNVAWLPADKIFLRAIQLPSSDLNEIRSMVELQIEKLSPLPVTQIVWSIQLLPNQQSRPAAQPEKLLTDATEAAAAVPLQTVVVIIAARSYVEEFLGELENQGFLTDRLEVPGLQQLVLTKATGNGVWVYVNGPSEPLLITWWYGGTLHNLAMVSLPDSPDRSELLKNQIEQMAWAGELEGWLTEPPKIHLVATPDQASVWEPLLRQTTESELASLSAGVEVIPALKPADVAARAAEAAAQDSSTTNLLPDDYSRRYRQQFIDGLWMRALFGAVVLYGVAVIVYFAVVMVLNYRASAVTSQVTSLGMSYTNAIKDEEQLRILKERQELKYAGLDCWKAVADSIPAGVALDDLYFQRGKLELRGSAPADDQLAITEFNDHMRGYKIGDSTLFTEVNPPAVTIRGDRADWRFSCIMKGSENR
jgi:hypothetical protein